LGNRPIADIKPLDVLDVLRKIEQRDAIEMAKRVMQMASAIFKYAIVTARCRRDPTADLKGALKATTGPGHGFDLFLSATQVAQVARSLLCGPLNGRQRVRSSCYWARSRRHGR
jgi:integrase